MFGSKARRIARLEDELEQRGVQLQLEFVNSTKLEKRLKTAESGRVEAIAQLENLKEQLARALDEKQRVSNEHALLSEELEKTKEQVKKHAAEVVRGRTELEKTQEELRTTRQDYSRQRA